MTSELRSYDTWERSMRNFEWLLKKVSGATDIDCLIERNGHFLVVEGKPWRNGVEMPYGQHKALYRLSKQPNTRVYLVGETGGDRIHITMYNDSPPPVYVRRTRKTWWPPERFVPTTKELFVLMVEAWWKDAGG